MPALTISFNFAGQRGSDAPAVAMTNSGWVPEAFFPAGTVNINSVTAGTIFHGTRKPLTLWFKALW